jgi:hypothetical protein
MAAFERKVLGRMFGGIKVNEHWKKWYSKELMQLNGIGHVNRMDSKRKH